MQSTTDKGSTPAAPKAGTMYAIRRADGRLYSIPYSPSRCDDEDGGTVEVVALFERKTDAALVMGGDEVEGAEIVPLDDATRTVLGYAVRFPTGWLIDYWSPQSEDPKFEREAICVFHRRADALLAASMQTCRPDVDEAEIIPIASAPAAPGSESTVSLSLPQEIRCGFAVMYPDGQWMRNSFIGLGDEPEFERERQTIAVFETREGAEFAIERVGREFQDAGEWRIVSIPLPAIPAATNEGSAER